jgi:hypothetical protein
LGGTGAFGFRSRALFRFSLGFQTGSLSFLRQTGGLFGAQAVFFCRFRFGLYAGLLCGRGSLGCGLGLGLNAGLFSGGSFSSQSGVFSGLGFSLNPQTLGFGLLRCSSFSGSAFSLNVRLRWTFNQRLRGDLFNLTAIFNNRVQTFFNLGRRSEQFVFKFLEK